MRRRLVVTALLVLTGGAAFGQARLTGLGPEQEADRNDRVVIIGMAPIPDVGEGAPRFTSDDLQALIETTRDIQTTAERDNRRCSTGPAPPCFENADVGPSATLACEIEYARRAANLALKAEETTRAAEEVRRAVASGEATQQESETAELARQEAVTKMERMREKLREIQADIGAWQHLMLMGRKNISRVDIEVERDLRTRKGYDIFAKPGETPPGLVIANVRAVDRTDSKGGYTAVFGEIRNNGKSRTRVPSLSGALVDERGWVLHRTLVSPPGVSKSVAAGKTYPFGFEIRPSAEAGSTAVVTFAAKNAPRPRLRMGFFCGPGANGLPEN